MVFFTFGKHAAHSSMAAVVAMVARSHVVSAATLIATGGRSGGACIYCNVLFCVIILIKQTVAAGFSMNKSEACSVLSSPGISFKLRAMVICVQRVILDDDE